MKRYAILVLLLGLAGCEWFQVPGGAPSVSSAIPASGAENVSIGAAVKLDLDLPNGGVSLTSADNSTVTLTDTATGEAVAADVKVNNDSERLTLTPSSALDFGTEYRYEVTSGVEDEAGQAFAPYSGTFTTVSEDVPSVTSTVPADGATDVSIYDTTTIIGYINGVGDGVSEASLGDDVVYLTNLNTGERLGGDVTTSGGGDTISFTPNDELEEGTEYQFDVTSGVLAVDGTPFTPYTSTFITTGGTNPVPTPGDVELAFQQSSMIGGEKTRFSTLTVGPGSTHLYAATIDGRIVRFPIGSDGSLGAAEQLTTIAEPDGAPRLTVGVTFDPASTSDNLIAWVSSTGFSGFDGGDSGGIQNGNVEYRWAGKITRLSGPTLSTQQDYVVGLPRSSKDHVTNSIAFNPDEPGVLYFLQGSNTAMGAPDNAWRFQPERVLAGAVLRLDTNAIASLPLDVKTEDGGSYDPYAAGAPLTIYASGTRNAYDLVWHSNGHLYVPANGSAAGGIMPSYDPLPGTCENRPDGGYSGTTLIGESALPGFSYVTSGTDPVGVTVPVNGWRINEVMNDYLFDIEAGGYYGTPNPKRCEWILFGGGVGGPTGQEDIIDGFPSSVQPDPNYRGYAYNFGKSISPNGVIEYQGDAFSEYNGMLLVVRYSSGNNIVALSLDGSGNVTGETDVVPDNTFADPLDITQDPATGYLYVASYDQTGTSERSTGITLLRNQ